MRENKVSGVWVSLNGEKRFIWSNKYNQIISTNGMHYAIKHGNTVYDNLYPEGISDINWDIDLGITEQGIKSSEFDVQKPHPLWK